MKNLLRWLVIIAIAVGVVFMISLAIMGADSLFGLSMWPWIKETSSGLFHWVRYCFRGFFTGTVGNILIGILIAITFYLLYRLVQKIKIWLGIPDDTPLKALLGMILNRNKKALAIIAIAVVIVSLAVYFILRPSSGTDENDLAIQKVKLYEEMLAIYRIPAIGDLTEENIATFKADDYLTRTFCEFTTVELPKVRAKYLSLVKGDTAAETCSLRPQTNTAEPAVTDIPVSAPLPADADTIKDATIADPSPFFPEESPSPAKPAAVAAPAKPAVAPATAKPKPAAASNSNSNRHAGNGRPIYGNVQTGEYQGVSNDNRGDLAPGPTNNNNDLAPGPPESQLTSDRGDLAPGPR